jgi:hypothetical protein
VNSQPSGGSRRETWGQVPIGKLPNVSFCLQHATPEASRQGGRFVVNDVFRSNRTPDDGAYQVEVAGAGPLYEADFVAYDSSDALSRVIDTNPISPGTTRHYVVYYSSLPGSAVRVDGIQGR